MKQTFIPFVLFLLVGAVLYGQEKNTTSSLKTKKIQIVDSITVQQISDELPTTVVATKTKDTVVFALEDLKRARIVDSLWLQELYKSELFEDVYGTITNQTYEAVEYEELPTEVLKERLAQLNARTPFNVEYNPSLESVIKHYLKNRRRTMGRLMALSDYYFPMFEETLDKHNLPLELKYLAIVESALNPRAKSRVGATGLWQFMYNTGKIYGLEVSSYVDERSDPLLATEAASQYLKSLYNSLGDWDLALAAYNSGPGNVAKALRRAGGYTNYWNIRHHLPRETAGYLPAFLATMYIFEFAKEHGFTSEGPAIPYVATDTLHVKRMITLEQVAKITNVDLQELQFLNPSYKLDIIPFIENENYVLRLPLDAVGKFVANEEAVYAFAEKEFNDREKPLPEFFEESNSVQYRVRSGDYLGRIAEKYGVSVSQIKRWNGLRSNRLKVGQRLTIHTKKTASSGSISQAKASAKGEVEMYTVRSGDSLWSISQKFPGVTVQNIKKWNDISGTKLKPGMKLRVSQG
ncbi:LysM peptidoglycan-binding domain-containing protein [Altibacter lentus]|uniref:LysM peptidoglycan-binding domain-containing protein n=1 Tax=Altibacter lentus TaxID=1223410 RepID=UPI00054CF6D5|nr:LysM peptidoglycan-binding domain-containing protein [Altibacter lentus]